MMEIPGSVLQDMMRSTVSIGDVFLIEMDESDGITPKDGDDYRHKYFVVLGFDGMGNVYGGVVINSRINQHMSPIVQQYQMPISCTKYPFLKYNSFVNCSRLKTAPLTKLTNGKFLGVVEKEDVTLIIETVRTSPHERANRLRQFGLI